MYRVRLPSSKPSGEVMRINPAIASRAGLLAALTLTLTLLSNGVQADRGICGGAIITLPFTDVPASNIFFCSIAEAFFSGLTNGTTATTYSPGDPVPREQMAAFVTRTLYQSLKRGSRRAALKQFWTPTSVDGLGFTTVGNNPQLVESDGADLWVPVYGDSSVSRVRASDGKLLDTWTGAAAARCVLVAKGLIFVIGQTNPGRLYQIDPTQPAGVVTTLGSTVANSPLGISFDGARIWTANQGPGSSVSMITLNPFSVTTATAGFTQLGGIVYDGANMWVTDGGAGKLFKLDSNGGIIQTVSVGSFPATAVFDGTNIWVPNYNSNSVTVVRASTGSVLATLTGNGLNGSGTAAFDGERILVTNSNGDSVSLWRASDLSPLGSVSTGPISFPTAACSDGLNFWITLDGAPGRLARL
jgi:hypothetical protein